MGREEEGALINQLVNELIDNVINNEMPMQTERPGLEGVDFGCNNNKLCSLRVIGCGFIGLTTFSAEDKKRRSMQGGTLVAYGT